MKIYVVIIWTGGRWKKDGLSKPLRQKHLFSFETQLLINTLNVQNWRIRPFAGSYAQRIGNKLSEQSNVSVPPPVNEGKVSGTREGNVSLIFRKKSIFLQYNLNEDSKHTPKNLQDANVRKSTEYAQWLMRKHNLPLFTFVEKAYKKMKMFFISEKPSFFVIVSKFSHVQSCFLIFQNLLVRAEKTFSKKSYHLIHILQQICHLHRFWKKIRYFPKNPNFERFEKLYYFSGMLLQICCNLLKKDFTFRNVNKLADVAWTHWVNIG